MSSDSTHNPVRRIASNEPVALAGIVRAIIYSLLGTSGIDPSVLALIVVLAETVLSVVLRRFVSPAAREIVDAVGRELAGAGEPVAPIGGIAYDQTKPAVAT